MSWQLDVKFVSRQDKFCLKTNTEMKMLIRCEISIRTDRWKILF